MANSEGWVRAYPTGIRSILASASSPARDRRSIYGSWMAAAWRRFGRGSLPAQKSAGNRKTCGRKDTTDVPHRKRAI